MPKTITSGNVFADMGLENSEVLSMKAGLAREVNHVLDQRGLTQAPAARLLQIRQPQGIVGQ